MADLDVGAGAFGGRIRATVTAVPPFGWFGAVALVVVLVLAWHFWDQDAEDGSSWTDPQQPPTNVDNPPTAVEVGPLLARARRTVGPIPGAC